MFKTLSGRLEEFGLLGAVFVVLLGVEVWMGFGGCGDLSEAKVVSRDENELDSSMGVIVIVSAPLICESAAVTIYWTWLHVLEVPM